MSSLIVNTADGAVADDAANDGDDDSEVPVFLQ